ncbi:unnamed protein product, partial [Anisakis simplex]|uniref:Transcriptional regulator n=1 Tax=Anisakis simplex TaxID=6269 RepID=A0A0M3JGN4_ANISI
MVFMNTLNFGTIEKAVQSGDVETLKSSLQNCRDANLEFIEYYLIILQTITITEETTIEEIIEIIRRVNLAVLKAKQDAQKAANLNRLLLRAERNYAKDALKEDWKDKVIVDYLSDYVMRLEQE